MRFARALSALGLVHACAPTDRLEVRFPSRAIENITSEVRTFAFAGRDCEELDPRGLGPGDAEARTDLEADFAMKSSVNDDVLADFRDVPTGPLAVVAEAWGLPCMEIGGSAEEPSCTRLQPNGELILRGYFCGDLEVRYGARIDLIADLESFGLIGSALTVPTNFPANAVHYDDEAPLFVTDGLLGRDRFTVQVLNHLAEAENEVKVRFDVIEGAGTFDEPQPLITTTDPFVQDDGLASATLRANLTASASGRIVVSAHAPGYEGSPIRFVATSVPAVSVELESIPVAKEHADLGQTDSDDHPVILEDLDGNGMLDLVTVAGFDEHRLVLAYRDQGSVTVYVSNPIQGQVRAMAMASLSPGERSLVVSVADRLPFFRSTPAGDTYVIRGARFEVFEDLGVRPTSATFTANPIVITTEGGAPIEKAAVSIHGADIDGDGVDELALSRCSYVFLVNAAQELDVECNARLSDMTDSELALLRVTPSPLSVTPVARLLGEGNDGGFRDVRLVDIDGDGSLDLVAAASSIAIGVCGRAGMPMNGFGFNDAPRFFTSVHFGQAWSVAAGRFNNDGFTDLLVTGAVRSSSPNSGLTLVPGGPCEFPETPPPVIAGPKANSRYLVVRSADLNGDGWSDAVFLHRTIREIQIYLGGGAFGLAKGPAIRLPYSTSAEMDLGLEGDHALAATVAPTDNALVLVRIDRVRSTQ